MLINVCGTTFDKTIVEESGTTAETTYTTRHGYALGELGEDMTGLEIRDMRSWCQTPVLKVKSFISAITDTTKNGGWTVNLDPDFFNSNNPYYEQAWITLPAISDLEYAGYSTHDGGFVVGQTSWNEWKGVSPVSVTGTMDTEELNCPVINFSLTLTGYTLPFNNQSIYLSRQYPESRAIVQDLHNFFVQLVAYDSSNNVVAASNVLNFCTPKGGEYFPLSKYIQTGSYTPDGGVTREQVIQGQFNLTNSGTGLYTFTSHGGTNFDLSLGQNVSYSYLRIKITKVGFSRANGGYGWSTGTTNLNQYYLGDGTGNWVTAVTRATVLQVNASDALFPSGEQIASGAIIKKDKLLKSDFTPAEYLLGYTKIFGLHYDVHIESKTVDIKLRNNYYDGHVIDVNESIDRDKEIKITPLSFDKKFYDLKYKEDNKSMFLEQYTDTYSKTYGQQAINTNYEFNNDRKNLLENIPYQSAVEGLEKSKYYRDLYTRRLSRPIWTIVPWEYTLWTWNSEDENYDSTSKDMPGVSPTHATYWSSMDGYDIFPKIQFRDNSNGPVDTKNVLVFFNGFKGLQNSSGGTIPMWLTDENNYMMEINDSKPCWLYTERETDAYGQNIAIKITQLPVFGRYIKGNNDSIELSWDFGEPLELYNPTLVTQPQSTIYNQYWKTYIEDLYSVNTRVVTAYVHFKTPLSKESLKHFYFFDNSYWVINKIIDYNPNEAVTKIEFVKVNNTYAYTDSLIIDTNDYLIVNPTSIIFRDELSGNSFNQSNLPWGAYIIYEDSTAQTFTVTISTQQFDLNGGSATVTVNADDDVSWVFATENWMQLSESVGTGGANLILTIEPSTTGRTGGISVTGSNGSVYTWSITQSVGTVSIFPTAVTQTISASSSGVVYTISFQSNVPYTLSISENWISASTDGTAVRLCATSNNEGQAPRTGYVYLQYSGETKATITVTQMQEIETPWATFPNGTSAYTYTFASGIVDTYTGVNVSSNVEYGVETNQDWLSARTVEGGIEFCCLSENQTGQERSGTVSIVYDYQTLAVATIKQQESEVIVDSIEPDTNLVEFGYSDSSWWWKTIEIQSNTTWSASTTEGFYLNPNLPTVQEGNGLVQIIPLVSYNSNEDMIGYVNFQSSGATAQTQVIRYAPAVLCTTGITGDCHASSFTVYVTALTDFTVVSEDDTWLIPSIVSGDSATTSFTVTVTKNTSLHSEGYRSGNIELEGVYKGYTTKQHCTVKQEDMKLSATVQPRVWSIYANSATLTITSEIDWEISGETWMTFPQDLIGLSGHGSTSMTVYYSSTNVSRSGHIYVYDASDHDFYVDLDVEQPYVTLSVSYDIEWPFGEPQFMVDGNNVTMMTPTEIKINWYDIPSGASGKEPIIKFELYAWNSDYTEQILIATWEEESGLSIPLNTGGTIEQITPWELTGETQGRTNFELHTYLDRNPNEGSPLINYYYSGTPEWNTVYDPALPEVDYTLTGLTFYVSGQSAGGIYSRSGWLSGVCEFTRVDAGAVGKPLYMEYNITGTSKGNVSYTVTIPSSPGPVNVNWRVTAWTPNRQYNCKGEVHLEKQTDTDRYILSGDTYTFDFTI